MRNSKATVNVRKKAQILIGLFAFTLAQYAGAGTIGLQWDPVTNDSRVSGYEVHYGMVSGEYDSMIIADANGAATNTAIVSHLSPGNRYYFSVRSRGVYSTFVSEFSNEVSAIVSDHGSQDLIGFGTLDNLDHNWSTVSTNGLASVSGLSGAPVLIAGVPTYHGTHPGVLRAMNVNTNGFEIRFQEWDYVDGNHVQESIDYLLLNAGRTALSDGSILEVGSFNLDGTGHWKFVSFRESFAAPPLVLLSVQTYNGPQAVSIKVRRVSATGFQASMFEQESLMDGHLPETVGYLALHSPSGSGEITIDGSAVPYLVQRIIADARWSPVGSHYLKVEEEQSANKEIAHIDEQIDVLLIGNKLFAQVVSHNGADTVALRRIRPEYPAPLEWGVVHSVDHRWKTVPLQKAYTNPVVVAQSAGFTGQQAGTVRLRNIRANRFELRFQEWDYLDGSHAPEQVHYLVADVGSHALAGLNVQADKLNTAVLGRAGQWAQVALSQAFMSPAVFAGVQSANGGDAVTTRLRNLDFSGFELAMDEQESKGDGHLLETLGWIAIEKGSGRTSDGRLIQVFQDSIDHSFQSVPFSPTSRRYGTVVSTTESYNGMDPVFIRHRNVQADRIELSLQEEQSADAETFHLVEWVGVFVGE